MRKEEKMYFVFETDAGNWGIDIATQYTVNRHNYFYGTREDCHKWCMTHDIKIETMHEDCYDKLMNKYLNLKNSSLLFNKKQEMLILKDLLQREVDKIVREDKYIYDYTIIISNLLSRLNSVIYKNEE